MKPARSIIGLLVGLALAATLFLTWSEKSAALELSIIESGPDPNPTIGLWVRDLKDSFTGVKQLVSPAGDVFTPASILEGNLIRGLLLRFGSLSDAMDYVEGTWQATPASRIPVPSSAPFDFEIGPVPFESINRVAPSLISPTPGATIKNGTTFTFGWDYLTSDPPPNRTHFTQMPLFDPPSSWGGAVVSTPRPGFTSWSTGSTGTGDRKFSDTRTNVPGTDKNRFLVSLTAAEAALPLDVQFTLGSYYSFDDAVFPRRVGFYYSREIDPFTITLSTVPEPSSAGLVSALAVVCSLVRASARMARAQTDKLSGAICAD